MATDGSERNIYTYGISPVSGMLGRGRPERLTPSPRSARVWAAVGILFGLIWFAGFTSLVAIFAGIYSWGEYRSVGRRPIPAAISVILGVLGLLLAGYLQFG